MNTTEIQLQEMPSSSSLIAKIVDYKQAWEYLLAEVNAIEITSSLDTQPAHDVMKKAQKLLKECELLKESGFQLFWCGESNYQVIFAVGGLEDLE